jgi:hypothetical protein
MRDGSVTPMVAIPSVSRITRIGRPCDKVLFCFGVTKHQSTGEIGPTIWRDTYRSRVINALPSPIRLMGKGLSHRSRK